jgi:hypothetical protein
LAARDCKRGGGLVPAGTIVATGLPFYSPLTTLTIVSTHFLLRTARQKMAAWCQQNRPRLPFFCLLGGGEIRAVSLRFNRAD